jgi:acetyl/propionyl-CoA carboxylase alpha subunit
MNQTKIVKKIKRLAIANRGEVAVRIIKACEEMGIETVLLHSEPDRQSRAFRMATKSVCIGPASTLESYLNINSVIQGALAAQADAIHPGFGFLSENAEFAEAVERAGMLFVGPSSYSIRTLGDKIQFKNLAKIAQLPLIPGYEGADQSIARLIDECERIGYPVIVKAAAGGGGRGMKVIQNAAEASQLIESAQREAHAAFGSSVVFLEKYLDQAKHIEFQVFGDCTGKVEHFFERECSVQRRHQKIIEEAPSPSLSEGLRRKMAEAARTIAELGKYQSAGTVEFLVQNDEFYLLELNTRLQVEHPVTEEVMGVDLVKAQILTAQNEYVFDSRSIKVPHGHSIECRVYAEDSYNGGIPSTGKLGFVHWSDGPRRRFEYGFEEGDEITSFYDPMIAKVIVWDETRLRAIQKMREVLKQSVVFGVHTNIPYLLNILSHKEFVQGTMTTQFIQKNFPSGISSPVITDRDNQILSEARRLLQSKAMPSSRDSVVLDSPWRRPWRGA